MTPEKIQNNPETVWSTPIEKIKIEVARIYEGIGFSDMILLGLSSELKWKTQLDSIENVTWVGPWITFQWTINGSKKVVSIHVLKIFWEWDKSAVEEISYDEAQAKYITSIAQYQEHVLNLTALQKQISLSLKKNNGEVWEVLDKQDIILQWPLKGKTLVEGILIFRKHILDGYTMRAHLGNIDLQEFPSMNEASEELFNAQEEYLLLSLWIWEYREELTHVIPKSQNETGRLINLIVSRRNPDEILSWMRNIHAQIDGNNWQDGTVEKNYAYFIDRLNILVLKKLKKAVFDDHGWKHYHNPEILLHFAVLVSGRMSWDKESALFMQDGLGVFDEQSPVDSRLWRPEISEEALSYAMDVPTLNEQDEKQSMISKMMPHLDISDPLMDGKTPSWVINNTINLIREGVQENDGSSFSQLLDAEFDKVLEWLWYLDVVKKSRNNTLWASYDELSLKEMLAISWLSRIAKGLQTTEFKWAKWRKKVATTKTKYVSVIEFLKIALSSAQSAVTHVGKELDKNFDDSWSDVWHTANNSEFQNSDGTVNEEKVHQVRAAKFGIIDPNSNEYKIFRLYNDINGNGGLWEVSDGTREMMKTGGYILAMVAWAMLLWGATIFSLWKAGITISSMAGKWATIGMAWSATWYWLDSVIWDARWFYTSDEALLWVSTDFALGWATGALSWPLAKMLPKVPSQAIFAWDLAVLGIIPEMKRIEAMNQAWHGSDIFNDTTLWQSIVSSEVREHHKKILHQNWSQEQIEKYIQNPKADISPHLKEYRFFIEEFNIMGFTPDEVDIDFDIRFQRAYAISSFLSPGRTLNIWQDAPEFIGLFENRQDMDQLHRNILNAAKKWIKRQEQRLEAIS